MTVGSLGPGGRGRVSLHDLADLGPLLVGHDGELGRGVVDPVERDNRVTYPTVDLGSKRATGDRQRHDDRDRSPIDDDVAHHAEVDDAAMQFGILDRSQGVDDLRFGDGHGYLIPETARGEATEKPAGPTQRNGDFPAGHLTHRRLLRPWWWFEVGRSRAVR